MLTLTRTQPSPGLMLYSVSYILAMAFQPTGQQSPRHIPGQHPSFCPAYIGVFKQAVHDYTRFTEIGIGKILCHEGPQVTVFIISLASYGLIKSSVHVATQELCRVFACHFPDPFVPEIRYKWTYSNKATEQDLFYTRDFSCRVAKNIKRTPLRHSVPPFEPLLKILKALKLEGNMKEGYNALVYMDRCHQSKHTPSAASLHSLEDTLIRVYEASNDLQVR